MSSLAALAEYPGRVEDIFLNKTTSKAGVYAVQLYALNVPITIMVDDFLPVREYGRSYSTWFAKVGEDSSLWGPIIEKAFSKFHGNYARTVAGDPTDGVSTLNGSPSFRLDHSNVSESELWN